VQHKEIVIAHAYYFLCEMLLLFLLTFPLFYHYYVWVPFKSYLLILAATCLIFSYIAYKKMHPIWLWSCFPVLCAFFVMLDYPMFFAILFSVVYVIDYAIIHKQELLKREAIYIISGIIISGILLLITNTWTFLSYLMLLILFVFVGYTISNIAGAEKQARKQFPYRLFLYFIIALTGIGAVFSIFANVLKDSVLFIWHSMISIFTYGLNIMAYGIGYFFSAERSGWPKQKHNDVDQPDNPVTEQDISQYIPDYLMTVITIVIFCLMFAIIVFLTIKYFKNRKKKQVVHRSNIPSNTADNIHYADIAVTQKETKKRVRMFKKPEHPIRKLVFRFERKAEKYNKGRLPFETVSEWLKRIGMDDELSIYQQVRYGDVSKVEEADIEFLRKRLNVLRDELGNE